MARTPEQRGPFGRWLVSERKARGWTADDFRARLQETRGFAMAHSTFALLESGQRQPTDEQRRHLTAFLGSEPDREAQGAAAPDMAALVAVLTNMVAEMKRQNDRAAEAQAQMHEGLSALAEEVQQLRAALRAHEGAAGPHGAPTQGAGGAPQSRQGGPRKSQAAVR